MVMVNTASGINNIAMKGTNGDYYNSVGRVDMGGLFSAHIDRTDLTKTQAAFGFFLEEIQAGKIDFGKLNIVGDNAVKYAQQLLESQIKDSSTGNLKNSIGYNVVTDSQSGKQSLEIYATAVNQSGIPYGTFVEYGSHPGGGPTYVQPRPFLRPAIEFARANTTNNIQETLKHIFENITKGDYKYAEMHFSGNKETRIIGNRALATKSSVRNTSNNKDYGRPTRTALNQLGKSLKASYGERANGRTYDGISSQISNSHK